MDIYHYHPITHEFLGQGLADPDPLDEENWLVPAYATTVAAPPAEVQCIHVFRPESATWDQVADFRGTTQYSTTTDDLVPIVEFGKTPADLGLTDQPRPSPDHVWQDGAWVLDAAKQRTRLTAAALVTRDQLMADANGETVGMSDAFVAGLLDAGEEAWFKAMAAYKRDLTRIAQQPGFPKAPVWPIKPSTPAT